MVSCGNHEAPTCRYCSGNSSGCNGDCEWSGGKCIELKSKANFEIKYICSFVCNRGHTIQYHGGLRSRINHTLWYWFPNFQTGVIISPAQTIGYRIEIVYPIGTLSNILQHFTYNEIQSPTAALLADGALYCGMYPAGKVPISLHLVTPGFPRCDYTVSKLSADAGAH